MNNILLWRYPTFEKPEYLATVPEDAVPGILVEQVKATDADFGVNAEISYRIQQGNKLLNNLD